MYNFGLYSGPRHTLVLTGCLVFTSGGIDGFPDSGTWADFYGDWASGNYIHDGRQLRWYGTLDGSTTVINVYNKLNKQGVPVGKGGYDEWDPSTLTAVDDGIAVLGTGCAPGQHQSYSSNHAAK